MAKKPHIVVVGAGAFGGWSALHLLERGARVTLLDTWGPGNSRASSGGETRIMRCAYGPDRIYTAMAMRAIKLWRNYERKWKRQMLHRTGVLWMASGCDDSFERSSVEAMRERKVEFQELTVREMKKRWPQINFSGIDWGLIEPSSGYLEARASCQAVVDAFVSAGGTYRQCAVSPAGLGTSLRNGIKLLDRDLSRIRADFYVFACGPWMGKLFHTVIGDLIQPTKQDVYFFGPPKRSENYFTDAHLPVWGNHFFENRRASEMETETGEAQTGLFFYGIPGSDRRGFKVADDTRGEAFDPTDGERVINPETLKRVREFIAFRFPGLKNAPLLETRVCQYEQSPDGHLIIDRHPRAENVWLVGGGSGHGFKHGPAIGEMMAELILKDREPDPKWKLSRFSVK